MPDPGSAKVMALVDAMPAAKRALVYEYGLIAVLEMGDGVRPRDLAKHLKAWRSARQQQWLKTDYVRKERTTR